MKALSIKKWSVLLLSYLAVTANSEFHPTIHASKESKVSHSIKYFDDSSNILILRNQKLYISYNDGESYTPVKETKDEVVAVTFFDDFFPNRAVAITHSSTQYYTADKGKTWKSFELTAGSGYEISSKIFVQFNSKNKDYALVDYYECPKKETFNDYCKHVYLYTEDGFKSKLKKLPVEANICKFVSSSKEIQVGTDKTILCSENKLNSFGHIVESSLFKSDDFFKTSNKIHTHYARSGAIIAIRVDQNFILVVVQNDKFSKFSKVSFLVSKDAEKFYIADLKVDFSYGIMNFLDSSPSSLFLSISEFSGSSFSTASVYSSDSQGLRYTKILDQVQNGAVKRVQTIDGAWLANVISLSESTGEESLLDIIVDGGSKRLIQSKFSFNDGLDWEILKVNNGDCDVSKGCSLHILTPNERDGEGKFVTGPTPGILLAVGSEGKALAKGLDNMKTYISRDGGASWDKVIDEPCQFAFGDQGNVIIAISYQAENQKTTDKLYYSLDQGKTWQTESLEYPVYPITLTTTTDGTSAKFVLSGLYDRTPDNQHDYDFEEALYSFDFSKAFNGKTCGDNDFEEIYARVTEDNQPICVYGHREKFRRRKQDAKCFVNKLFEDIKVYDDPCACTDRDFECARGFTLSDKGGACVPDTRIIRHICHAEGTKEITLPDKVLIDGDKCDMGNKKIKDFVTTTKFKCSEYLGHHEGDKGSPLPGSQDDIVSTLVELEGKLSSYSYMEISENSTYYKGENVIVRTTDNRAYISNNGGISFSKVPVAEKIYAFYVGYIPGQLVLITDTDIIYVSDDGGSTFRKTRVPSPPVEHIRAISFHKTDDKQFIWYSESKCEGSFLADCKYLAHITKNGGESFDELKDNVVQCDFVSPFLEKQEEGKDLIFCSTLDKETGKLALETSNNYFRDSTKPFDNIVGYAATGTFIVVATVSTTKKSSLQAKVTVDGYIFADADFPSDFHVDSEQAYTVLDSQSRAIFMHVTTNSEEGHEFGSILKSNSNGTSYVLSLEKVNRNRVGYVDYDRIEGIEGVIIANVVSGGTSEKNLKTMITHNDGGEWSYLTPPPVNSLGKKYPCNGQPLERCSLHLHGFTERPDYRDTYSSASATGLLIGVGSVGATLDSYDKSSTFLSNDGGITWKEIKHGVFMWEYGDRGTVLVLVDANETDTLLYSLDDGETWLEFKFAKDPIKIDDLATVPSDTSRKFIIFGHSNKDSSVTLSYSIDFSNIHKRQCQLDLDHPDLDDFEYWSPSHPNLPDNCLFGHESKFLRRAVGHSDCFIGGAPLSEGFKVTRNCSCTRRDFECDYNFYRDTDNTCKLVEGLSPSDRKNEICKKEGAFEYNEPTGYRKIPLSTCVGGKQFDSWDVKPCPGKESEFNKHYGKEVTGGKLFLVLFVPLFVFLFATWFVYDRGIRRNGGFKRFGQIRLDLDDDDFHPIENNQVDVVVNKIVRGGILVAAGTFATFKTVRAIDRMLLDKATSFIFRRTPGRRNYVQVPDIDEEDELFGDFRDDFEDEIDEEINQDIVTSNEEIAGLEANEPAAADVDERLFNIDELSDDEPAPQQ
ncbi:vacuolar protein sorting/targeting protein 10 [Scheffersomyces xylosifermentans]|uniref:vacuolar protein sorting/targeting protein 10 n=1 Tax=Scheffersomyces xylosifermentans TaxID=1304137 RepID=UPI00315D1ADD